MLPLALVVVIGIIVVVTLARRVSAVEQRLAATRRDDDVVRDLARRIAVLEKALRAQAVADAPVVHAATAPAVAPPVEAPPILEVPQVLDVAPAAKTEAAPRTAPPVRPVVHMPPPVLAASAAEPVAAGAPSPAAAPEEPAPWEVVVGTSWLNKIGVLVFVTGVALLLGYSMAHVGPFGRVAVGYLLSFALLGTGVVLERRKPAFASYAYGLVAGGWAGIYFTTYATHAVDAARIVESDLVAAVALVIVAAGMLAHSLRYRSQTVTALAYVIAYGTLTLTPLSGFSLAASIPLAASVLVVAQRFGWTGVSALGVALTYGLFVVRTQVASTSPFDPESALPFLTLALYWLTFEAADLIGLRRRADIKASPSPVFALNALGFLGALLLDVRTEDPQRLAWMIGGTGAAYLTSAFVRARLLGALEGSGPAAPTSFSTVQGSVVLAAGLFAWAIDLGFSGPRETLALLVESELLIAASIALNDAYIRRTGSAVGVLVTLHALTLAFAGGDRMLSWPWPMFASTPVLALVAVTRYANREWLRRHAVVLDPPERLFTWMALGLLGLIIGRELAPAYQGIAGLVLAAALLEAGLRQRPEYRYQAYLAGALGAFNVLAAFLLEPNTRSPREIWTVLPAVTALTYGVAWRLSRRATGETAARAEFQAAAGAAACAAAAFLAAFEWRVCSPMTLGPTWTATGLSLVALGAWRRMPPARWQGFGFALLGASRAVFPLLESRPDSTIATAAVAAVITLLYVSSYVWQSVVPAPAASSPGGAERAAAGSLGLLGTVSLALLEWRVLPFDVLAPAWTATAIVLLGIGASVRHAALRWQAYALFAIASARTLFVVLNPVTAPTETIIRIAVVIGQLYAASFAVRSVVHSQMSGGAMPAEEICRLALSLAATLLLTVLVLNQIRPTLVTLAWGLEGTALLAVGFPVRERVLRLSGLALLLLCILKLFLHDLSQLEPLARILSFVVLGLALLGVSWTYTRYKEQIRRFL